MGILRKSVAALGAIGLLASSTAASAQVRPSDSLVSPAAAASAAKSVQGLGQGRTGAKLEDANSFIQFILIFLVIGTTVTAVWVAVDESP